jgi:gluconate 2-dehydrogenase gamma chain
VTGGNLTITIAQIKNLDQGVLMSEENRALTESEFAAVEAIAGRILPATDTPGAIEAGAAHYIDRALGGDYAKYLDIYKRALDELDRHCDHSFGMPFAALDATLQDKVLEGLEAQNIAGITQSDRFFDLILDHVMEGMFCEPRYGGNRDLIGWKLVGFPGQRYGYPDPYINKMIDLEPVAHDDPPPLKD